MITLGSLFDGSGAFPLAAAQSGMQTLWASEIEPFAIKVTKQHFPFSEHLGDVRDIDGGKIAPVDIVTFGSPCQDLSVAGKQKGLSGDRSGLFTEAVRIIKEMKEATNGKYPKFAVWENVPGAFSSNKGEDFRVVLEELCKIADREATVPRPANGGGKWKTAGCIMGDDYSVAWRTLDAQYWGVPQRRRRIFLVADFRGGRAGKVLFESEGLRRRFAESRKAWERPAGANVGIADGKVWDARGNGDGKTSATLTGDHDNRITDYTNIVCINYAMLNCGVNSQVGGAADTAGVAFTLLAKGAGAVFAQVGQPRLRRFTPRECARLQGMPDWWCDHVPHSDTAEYKLWGNGIALPCAMYVMENIRRVIGEEEEVTE